MHQTHGRLVEVYDRLTALRLGSHCLCPSQLAIVHNHLSRCCVRRKKKNLHLLHVVDAAGVMGLQLCHLQRLGGVHHCVQHCGVLVHSELPERRHLLRQEHAQRHL